MIAERVRAAVRAFNDGDRGAIGRALGRSWYEHVPAPDEPGASEVIGSLLADIVAAFPNLAIEVGPLATDGEAVRGEARLRGSRTAVLWGVPPNGESIDVTFPLRARAVEGGLAIDLDGVAFPVIVDLLRRLELMNPADRMHLPPPHETGRIPELILRLAFNGQVGDKACTHLGEVRVTDRVASRCDRCGPEDVWPALRMCLTCGHIGCCDTSINKHARGHFEATGHPLMRSLHPGEAWIWCYVDGVFFGRATLERIAAGLAGGAAAGPRTSAPGAG